MNKIIIGRHSSTMPGVESSIDKASPNYSNILTFVWLWVLNAMGDTNSLYQQLFVASTWLAKMLQTQPLQNSYYLSYGGASSQSCCNFYDKAGFIACITNLYVNGYNIMDWSDRSAMSPDEPVCLDMGDDGSLFLWIRPLSYSMSYCQMNLNAHSRGLLAHLRGRICLKLRLLPWFLLLNRTPS